VSQQLAGLERAAGVPVLERAGRNVRLTDAGRELVRHADRLLAGVEAAQLAVEQLANGVEGTLTLSVYESVATTLLPVLLRELGARYPALSIRTRQCEPDEAIEALVRGELELAFTIDYPHAPATPRTDVVRFPILDDRFHLVVPADQRPGTDAIELSQYADHAFVASPLSESCGRCVILACRRAGFEPDIVHQIDDYPTTLRLVAAGHGVALVPDLGLRQVPDDVAVVELADPLIRRVELSCRATSAGRPAITAVRDTLLDRAQEVVGSRT
jgi:DNA-binding transcriptional LysR family regulator